MSRPKFPEPYTVLTPNIISRIISEQDFYDKDPERYEREQKRREEDRILEQEQERQEYDRQRR